MSSLISLADQFEQMDRALTSDELAQLLAVSHVTIFKLSKVSGIAPAFCAAGPTKATGAPAAVTSRRRLMQRNGRRKFVYNPDPRSAPLDVEAEPDGKE